MWVQEEDEESEEEKMKYNYIVWVGGVDDYYVNYSDAKRDYDEWVSQGYDEVCIEKIEEEK